MRIDIDPGACEGNAVCEAMAPMVFALDDRDQARVIGEAVTADGSVPDEHRLLVERAAEGCPRLAIRISG
ncbi:ferredoxin [Yinghuangia sp. ASG 101]|uniref:ferredoxin n=1 Tax=Yinghuangia sp. ASG 101 TaxID=2896848 RepID=UPI001E5CC3F8|nr:ferredoxin [Yinghuangia sp. ASG 101]UGQ11145.1 ferredoxin [Yinghuangia sp. ASG 101]